MQHHLRSWYQHVATLLIRVLFKGSHIPSKDEGQDKEPPSMAEAPMSRPAAGL